MGLGVPDSSLDIQTFKTTQNSSPSVVALKVVKHNYEELYYLSIDGWPRLVGRFSFKEYDTHGTHQKRWIASIAVSIIFLQNSGKNVNSSHICIST